MRKNFQITYFLLFFYAIFIAWFVIRYSLVIFVFLNVVFFLVVSCILVFVSNGLLFFFDRKREGRFNLLYLWVIPAGGLLINGATNTPGLDLNYLKIFEFTFYIFSVGYIFAYFLFSKFWDGLDTFLAFGTAWLFVSVGFAMSL